jgi:hypothetical protein
MSFIFYSITQLKIAKYLAIYLGKKMTCQTHIFAKSKQLG